MNRTKLKKVLKLFLKIGFTTVLLYFVFKKIDFHEVANIFRKSNPFLLLLALLFFFISQVVSSSRLLTYLKNAGLNLSFVFNFRLYLLGMFYNIFLPGGIGGDGYKIYLLRKKFQVAVKKIFWSLFFDRLGGLWAVCFGAVVLFIFTELYNGFASLIMLSFAAGTLIYYLILKNIFELYASEFILKHGKALLVQFLQVLSAASILAAIHLQDNYAPYLFTFLVSSIVSIIPITIGGLGAREYVMVYAASFLSIDKNTGVFMSGTFWLLTAIVSLSGMYYAYNSKEFTAPDNEVLPER